MSKLDLIPSVVSDFIDEDILPELANGKRSARKITQIVVDQAYSWLTDEAEGHNPISDDKCLSYCWVIACKLHRDLMVEYIDHAFENFEE
ncbi:hypothetical protein [Lactiplantibacillus pingfangensis]|uniref:hypothetical protein n=1 Tax=Lactiplantibacillus pingfangensis TaxID=2559915 RepID=UPI0010F84E0E|nr:hypothetical protein [Lactiplantibacillus pingfangensis]